MRGRVPRIQIKKEAKAIILIEKNKSVKNKEEGKKIAAENILIARILVYSAMKIKANGPLLYSVLKPETSSDSPSARSKGVRLVSASMVIIHIKNIGKSISIGQETERRIMELKLKDFRISSIDSKIKAIETS